MADRVQFRRDTKQNWETYNPILFDGEIGVCTDDRNLYKMGDGTHTWNELPYRGFNGNIVNELGDNENAVMSQKFVTEQIEGSFAVN